VADLPEAQAARRRTTVAIPGVSDQRRFPRLGKIRLGHKVRNKSGRGEHPEALDHFSFVDVPHLEERFGKPCRELPILIPHEDPAVFFPQNLRWYGRAGVNCGSEDGQTALRVRLGETQDGHEIDSQGEAYIRTKHLNVEVGDRFTLPCHHKECPIWKANKCKGIARFIFMVQDDRQVGFYEIATSSRNSIIDLNSALEFLRSVAGRVSMIPVTLKIGPVEKTVKPGKGKRPIKKTFHTLTLGFDRQKLEHLAEMGKRGGLFGTGPSRAQLPHRAELDKEVPDDLYPGIAHREGEPQEVKAEVVEPQGKAPERPQEPLKEPLKEAERPPGASDPPNVQPAKPEPAEDPPESEEVEGPGAQPAKMTRVRIEKVTVRMEGGRTVYSIYAVGGGRFDSELESIATRAKRAQEAGEEVVIDWHLERGIMQVTSIGPGDLA